MRRIYIMPRISTHGFYNNYNEIDYAFARLIDQVDQVNLSGLSQHT